MTKPLRRAVDLSTIVAAIVLTAILGWHFSGEFKRDKEIQSVRESLRQFERVLSMQGTSKTVPTTRRGWPLSVEPVWFGEYPPQNILLTPDRPWVEIASIEDAHLKDPNIRVAADYRTPGFWYNPYQGIVRARVPYEISDEKARDMYNQINGTMVSTIYGTELPRYEDIPYGPPAELAGTATEPPPPDLSPER